MTDVKKKEYLYLWYCPECKNRFYVEDVKDEPVKCPFGDCEAIIIPKKQFAWRPHD